MNPGLRTITRFCTGLGGLALLRACPRRGQRIRGVNPRSDPRLAELRTFGLLQRSIFSRRIPSKTTQYSCTCATYGTKRLREIERDRVGARNRLTKREAKEAEAVYKDNRCAGASQALALNRKLLWNAAPDPAKRICMFNMQILNSQ